MAVKRPNLVHRPLCDMFATKCMVIGEFGQSIRGIHNKYVSKFICTFLSVLQFDSSKYAATRLHDVYTCQTDLLVEAEDTGVAELCACVRRCFGYGVCEARELWTDVVAV